MIDSKKIIKEAGLDPNKALGQNFLIDESALSGICELACPGGQNVLEIGPGIGALTDRLAESAKLVLAVEIDGNMVELLSKTLAAHNNVRIVHSDFLRMKNSAILDGFGGEAFTVAANLPYYITSEAAMKLIDSDLPINRMVLMMQKEAAEHFIAAPRAKCYTPVSVISQRYYTVSQCMKLTPASYYPEPAVDSAVLLFERNGCAYDRDFSRVVKTAFSMRRKTLRNNLSKIVPKDTVPVILEDALLSPSARAEELSPEDFSRLAECVKRFSSAE
ncbi:MAG: ribosomal RNA small subunit methyltransferase A [Clostridia bacterium]|nr:ribosomal RNA small subunit methyltransferase A [Clostridia bacterium]MBQ5488190.1 ribosomal RNA small subunit methyltransferase A [Clostridia bacterium]